MNIENERSESDPPLQIMGMSSLKIRKFEEIKMGATPEKQSEARVDTRGKDKKKEIDLEKEKEIDREKLRERLINEEEKKKEAKKANEGAPKN